MTSPLDHWRLRSCGLSLAILGMTISLAEPASAEPSEDVPSDGSASLRVAFNGTESDFAYRVTMVHEGTPLVTCSSNCSVKLSRGKYFVEVEPPAGSGWRNMEEPVSLREDSVVEARPGRISPHGWGLGLTIVGTIAIVGGAVGFTLTHLPSAEKNDALSMVSIATIGAGGLSLGAGIYLLAGSSNQLDVRPMRQTAVGMTTRTIEVGANF